MKTMIPEVANQLYGVAAFLGESLLQVLGQGQGPEPLRLPPQPLGDEQPTHRVPHDTGHSHPDGGESVGESTCGDRDQQPAAHGGGLGGQCGDEGSHGAVGQQESLQALDEAGRVEAQPQQDHQIEDEGEDHAIRFP